MEEPELFLDYEYGPISINDCVVWDINDNYEMDWDSISVDTDQDETVDISFADVTYSIN